MTAKPRTPGEIARAVRLPVDAVAAAEIAAETEEGNRSAREGEQRRLTKRIDAARGHLAETALSDGANDLGRIVNDIAEMEGKLFAYAVVEDAMSADKSLDERIASAKARLFSMLLRGSDDTWSGRGNDTRRAWADGFRDAARDITSWHLS